MQNTPHILIIDDEDKLRGLLSRLIALEGFQVEEAADARSAFKKLEQHDFHVVICDVNLPDANGIELTQKIKAEYPFSEVIVLTAYGAIHDGVQAMKNGAFDYLVKGDDNDKLIPLINRAAEKAQMQLRIYQLEKKISVKYSFENIIGNSKQIQEAIGLARKVSATDAAVLLLGETGTGKEVFAQAIHYNSNRKNKNFVAVNCAALGKELLESELFGYKAGAFTGAVKDKPGLFNEANEGTIFLDEIGEMNMELQSKLLRVLETNEFIRLGDTKSQKVNVRLITATNRDLEQEVDAGRFRSDLFYRIAVFRIPLPALRQRVKDIELLADFFIKKFSVQTNKPFPAMSALFLDKLKSYSWKGNIRELKNVLERAVILAEHNELTPEDLPLEIMLNSGDVTASSFELSEVEKRHIQKVLFYTKGNKAEAARLLNIGIATLYRKIDEYKIS